MSLLSDLQAQVRRLGDDLRERSEQQPFAGSLTAEYDDAANPPEPARPRTALSFAAWREERITQAAVGWVLATVFVRFCEDNHLVELPWIAGPGDRLDLAVERAEERARAHPEQTDRDWLEVAFAALSAAPVAAGLFDRAHNPLWTITPSHEGAKELLAFWRRRDATGDLVHDLTGWDTRNLGELYQHLSEHARKTYALLQTPEFVEEFILDLTLGPAIDEFGLDGLRVIDPTCGSGHFLLGVFRRLLARWRETAPAINDWELIRRSLNSVHGVDKNPFAVAIARFRLMVEAMREGGITRLDTQVVFPLNVAVGDSLLHGRGAVGVQTELFAQPHRYVTEDIEKYVRSVDMLGRASYHVVVGNPPYITVKDKAENENYRKAYPTCAGTYALSVPFAELFFRLARRAEAGQGRAGYVGQITANSFMKREFGKKLVTEFFGQRVELTRVIDTSGAFIPGHGTPTVILVGRNQAPAETRPVHTVLGVRGEPAQPEVPANGLVWQAIRRQYDTPGSESDWISVADLNRARLRHHPWSLSGGGASELSESFGRGTVQLSHRISPPIGRAIRAGADEAYLRPTGRRLWSSDGCRPIVVGELVRDWLLACEENIWYPYAQNIDRHQLKRELWRLRTTLAGRSTFAGNMADAGLEWWEYMQHTASAYTTRLSIAFAFVATHNHFVLDRGGKVFNRSAPVIKLPEGAGEDEHLGLLGVLNSSTACFWLKQVSHDKGSQGVNEGFKSQAWERFYEFTGKNLERFPLPARLPVEFGRALDTLAQELAAVEPAAVCARGVPTRRRLDDARAEHGRLRRRMIAMQEELDWDCYHRYGLLTEAEAADLRADPDALPEVDLGQRAFEIVLARAVEAGDAETVWFDRHGSERVTDVPQEGWPPTYQDVVRRRIAVIERRRDLALIERPECKRRWQSEAWAAREKEALRGWLLDRCEARELWYASQDGLPVPRVMTVNRLADALREDADLVAVAGLMADHLGLRDADLARVLKEIIADQHVPYLAALRYRESGLRKRSEWEQVWELQREEDRTGRVLDITVPQRYTTADFARPSYWRNRGKLDVPKERFISYPGANPDGDSSLLLGWAGWDHAERAAALADVITERSDVDGWPADRVRPLLAGLAEVMPWVWQWHDAEDPMWGTSPAKDYQAFLDDQRQRHGITEADLASAGTVDRPGRSGGRRRTT